MTRFLKRGRYGADLSARRIDAPFWRKSPMATRTRTALIGGVLIGALLLMGAGFPQKVTPAHFADGVCTTVDTWQAGANAGADELDTKITAATSIRQVRSLLASYLGNGAKATSVALDGLDEAGVPTTPKGAEASRTLKQAFSKIRASLRGFQHDAEDVSTKNKKKALKQLKALNAKVGIEFSSFSKALSKLKTLDPNHKLEKAFKANTVCAAL
jgi:hypothetical protein